MWFQVGHPTDITLSDRIFLVSHLLTIHTSPEHVYYGCPHCSSLAHPPLPFPSHPLTPSQTPYHLPGNMDVLTVLRTYSKLNILRTVTSDAAPSSNLSPAGWMVYTYFNNTPSYNLSVYPISIPYQHILSIYFFSTSITSTSVIPLTVISSFSYCHAFLPYS